MGVEARCPDAGGQVFALKGIKERRRKEPFALGCRNEAISPVHGGVGPGTAKD